MYQLKISNYLPLKEVNLLSIVEKYSVHLNDDYVDGSDFFMNKTKSGFIPTIIGLIPVICILFYINSHYYPIVIPEINLYLYWNYFEACCFCFTFFLFYDADFVLL